MLIGMILMWTHAGIGLATGLACVVGEQSMQYLWQSQQSLASWTSRLLPLSVPGQSVTTNAVILPSAEHAEYILVAMQHEWVGAGAASGAAMQVNSPSRSSHDSTLQQALFCSIHVCCSACWLLPDSCGQTRTSSRTCPSRINTCP